MSEEDAQDFTKHIETGADDPGDELGVIDAGKEISDVPDQKLPTKKTATEENDAMESDAMKAKYRPGQETETFAGRVRQIFVELARTGSPVPNSMQGQTTARMFGLKK